MEYIVRKKNIKPNVKSGTHRNGVELRLPNGSMLTFPHLKVKEL